MGDLRTSWSLQEVAKLFNEPPRVIRGWLDEGIVPTTSYRAEGGPKGERHVDRAGLVRLALMRLATEKIGDNAPLARELVRGLPEVAAHSLDAVDLEEGGTPQHDVVFEIEMGTVTIKGRFFERLIDRIVAEGLIV